jgi:hypothetical protein
MPSAALSDPMPGRVVRISVPLKTFHDLASMQKITASILGRLGCRGCHSGWDIRFDLIRSFAVDDKLNIREGLMGGGVIIDGGR